MDNLFNQILQNTSTEITFFGTLVGLLISIAFGVIIGITYKKSQSEDMYQKSMAITLIMLPVILCAVILFVGNNIARAFSLAGTLSIIRFRSAPGDAKDIGFIFFDIAAGLSCGVGLYGYGALFVLLMSIFVLICEKTNIFNKKGIRKNLKITVPEDLNYEEEFSKIIEKYTNSHILTKIKTSDLGSLFELVYNVTLKDNVNQKEFLDELRTKNGNLTIILSDVPRIIK